MTTIVKCLIGDLHSAQTIIQAIGLSKNYNYRLIEIDFNRLNLDGFMEKPELIKLIEQSKTHQALVFWNGTSRVSTARLLKLIERESMYNVHDIFICGAV